MSLALAQLLPEFHLPNQRQAMVSAQPTKKGSPEPDPAMMAALRQEGFLEGHRQAHAELLALHASEIEELQAVHQAELEAQASSLAVQVAQAVPAAITAREDRLLNQLADDIAAVLAPVVEENARQKMVAALIEEIRSVLELGQAQKITITGPEVWLEAMRITLGADLSIVEFQQSETADIDVAIDQTRLSSRFEGLKAMLREAMS